MLRMIVNLQSIFMLPYEYNSITSYPAPENRVRKMRPLGLVPNNVSSITIEE